MVVAMLTISKDGKMHWDEKKKDFGTRPERHSLGRFVKKQACHLPVTVLVDRRRKSRKFYFEPVLMDDDKKLVLLTHKKYFRVALKTKTPISVK